MENSQLPSDVERLAESLGTVPGPRAGPAFVVLSGLPGTEKTHLAARLAGRAHFPVLESDALCNVLLPSPDYYFEEGAASSGAIQPLIRLKPATEEILRCHHSVDSSRDVTPVIDAVLQEIEERGDSPRCLRQCCRRGE